MQSVPKIEIEEWLYHIVTQCGLSYSESSTATRKGNMASWYAPRESHGQAPGMGRVPCNAAVLGSDQGPGSRDTCDTQLVGVCLKEDSIRRPCSKMGGLAVPFSSWLGSSGSTFKHTCAHKCEKDCLLRTLGRS